MYDDLDYSLDLEKARVLTPPVTSLVVLVPHPEPSLEPPLLYAIHLHVLYVVHHGLNIAWYDCNETH